MTLKKIATVQLGALVLMATLGGGAYAQTTTTEARPNDVQQAQAQCASDGGWFDSVAQVCDEPSM